MNMKLIAPGMLAAGLAVSGLAYAEPNDLGLTVTGNIALTSDYRYRGLSQSDEGPAVQGGFDVGHESGLYAGIWASSVDFGNVTEETMEVDYYAGFSGKIVEDVSFDVGVLYYDYPQDGEFLDWHEFYGSISFAGFTLGAAYSPEYTLEYGDSYYAYLDYAAGLPYGLTLGLHIGYSDIGEDKFGEKPYQDGRYVDYSISLSKEVLGVNLGLAYVDTDLSEDDCPELVYNEVTDDFDEFPGTTCQKQFVFTMSKSL